MNVETTMPTDREFVVRGEVHIEEPDHSVGYEGLFFADAIFAIDPDTGQRIKLNEAELATAAEMLCTAARDMKRSGREADEVEAGLERAAQGVR